MYADEVASHAADRFLGRHVDSVGALDLLLLLHETRERDWSAAELCERLRCPETWADRELERFLELGVIATSGDRFRYQRTGRHGPAIDAIASACRRDRAALVRRIFAPR